MKKYFAMSIAFFGVLFGVSSKLTCKFFNNYFFFNKISVQGYPGFQKEKGCIIISNHNHFTDASLIKQYIDSYLVVQSDKIDDYGFLFKHIFNRVCRVYQAIPYQRGDEKSGKIVKNIISNLITENKNVLVFPEGACQKNSHQGLLPLKKGIFHLSYEKKIPMIITTIDYDDENFGTCRSEPINLNKILSGKTNVSLIFHCKVNPINFLSFDEYYSFCQNYLNYVFIEKMTLLKIR